MLVEFYNYLLCAGGGGGGGAKPSYGGGGKGFEIPNILGKIPNPIDFKAGVLR